MARPGPVRLVSVDGPGGAGKSAFATRLARYAESAPVVPTDDFASWEEPIDWWPRMLSQVIEPLASGRPGRYQRYDWVERRLTEWVTIEPAPIVVVEGVSSGRLAWSRYLAFTTWVETTRETRLRRGIERDGALRHVQWQTWMAAEDAHYAIDHASERADLVVDGEPAIPHDPNECFLAIRGAEWNVRP